jgi:hypothetical protein
MVLLTRIVEGKPTTEGTLPYERVVTCPICEQTYLLNYGEGERHHLSAWLRKADIAMLRGHTQNSHKTETLKLDW